MDELVEEQLVEILTKPKNAVVKQFQTMMEIEKVDLEITQDAVRSIARQAIERNMGARGLRSIIESIMLEVFYEVPSLDGVTRCVIDKGVVEGDGEPDFHFEKPEESQKQLLGT